MIHLHVTTEGDHEREWGYLEFLSVPSVGDTIFVDAEGRTHRLVARVVEHRPSMGHGGRPRVTVVCEWMERV